MHVEDEDDDDDEEDDDADVHVEHDRASASHQDAQGSVDEEDNEHADSVPQSGHHQHDHADDVSRSTASAEQVVGSPNSDPSPDRGATAAGNAMTHMVITDNVLIPVAHASHDPPSVPSAP
jgi:hypothetical protein